MGRFPGKKYVVARAVRRSCCRDAHLCFSLISLKLIEKSKLCLLGNESQRFTKNVSLYGFCASMVLDESSGPVGGRNESSSGMEKHLQYRGSDFDNT
jgi:hypothetical protein